LKISVSNYCFNYTVNSTWSVSKILSYCW
jgi:hypothetical protein